MVQWQLFGFFSQTAVSEPRAFSESAARAVESLRVSWLMEDLAVQPQGGGSRRKKSVMRNRMPDMHGKLLIGCRAVQVRHAVEYPTAAGVVRSFSGHAVFSAASQILAAAYASRHTGIPGLDGVALAEPDDIAKRRLLAVVLYLLLRRIYGLPAHPDAATRADQTPFPRRELEPRMSKTREDFDSVLAGAEQRGTLAVRTAARSQRRAADCRFQEQQGMHSQSEKRSQQKKPLSGCLAPGAFQQFPLCFLEREFKSFQTLSSQLERITQDCEQLLTAVTGAGDGDSARRAQWGCT